VPGSMLGALPAGQATPELLVRYDQAADRAAVDSRLATIAAGAGVATQTRDQQPSNAALHEDISGFGELSLMFPLLFLGAAGLTTYVLLSRLVMQQRAQIGLLVASGYRRRAILRHLLGFGLVTGAAGGIPGAIAGVALGGVVTDLYTGIMGLPDVVRIVELRPLTVLLGILFALGAGALSALAPALRASRISPAEAMRGSVPLGAGGASLVERLIPPLRGLPARWKMVLRGIGRNRVRSLSTMLGVALAAILVLVSWGMIDTMGVIVDRQFHQIDRQDAEIVLAAPATDSTLAAVAGVDGVAAAEPVAHLPVLVATADHSYVTTLDGFQPNTTMHGFLASGGGTEPLPDDGLLIGSALKDQLKVNVGDTVTVTLTSTGASMTDRVAGFVNEPLGTLAYASLPHLEALFGADAVAGATRFIQARYDAGAASDAVTKRLESVSGVLAVSDSQAIAKIFNALMGLFYAFVGVMLAFGAVMAFAILFVTIGSNVAERGTELATMRAMGMPIGVLGRVVSGENLLLTLAGIVPGLVLGYVAAAGFMASFNSDLFTFDLSVRPLTFVGTALGILVAAALSQWPALRAVRRLDLARVVRERAS
jgi:putative ABC transport system permease protein